MEILDGKLVREEILSDLEKKVKKLKRPLGLVVIQVGDDPASNVYIRQKEKMAERLGYNFSHLKFKANISQKKLLEEIDKLNDDDKVDGILVQMPLPEKLDARIVQNRINDLKDVDGLTDINMGKLMHNASGLVPCTPKGVMDLLKHYNIEVAGKNVVIVGRSVLVGKPLYGLMLNNNATVTICHSKTKDLENITKKADILVAAIGKPNFITKKHISKGTIVIDVGINRLADGKLCGDVYLDDVKNLVSYITPVPGGVGPMTVAELGYNTYEAYLLRNKK